MGASGCGKSTLGTALATAIGCDFLEGDGFHTPQAVAKMRAGEALTDQDRLPWLKKLGAAAEETLRRDGAVVLACSALKRSYRDILRQALTAPPFFVLLEAGRDELQRRLASRSGHFMPVALVESQLATLEPLQPDETGITLDALLPVEGLRDLVLGRLRTNG